MDSDRIQLLLRGNIVPILLGILGLVLVVIGVAQIFINKSEPSPLVFEENKEAASEIVVDVEGAVISPGVYSIDSKSRTVDALAAAGGLAEDADRVWVEKNINLAKRVSDGLKIYIPRAGEQVLSDSSSVSVGTAGPVININTASASDLDSLPGVGAVTSQKIIENRPYIETTDLLTKKILGQATYEKIKDKISAN